MWRARDCIPQYPVHHHRTVEAVQRLARDEFGGRLRVMGTGVQRAGVNHCVNAAMAEAARSYNIRVPPRP